MHRAINSRYFRLLPISNCNICYLIVEFLYLIKRKLPFEYCYNTICRGLAALDQEIFIRIDIIYLKNLFPGIKHLNTVIYETRKEGDCLKSDYAHCMIFQI